MVIFTQTANQKWDIVSNSQSEWMAGGVMRINYYNNYNYVVLVNNVKIYSINSSKKEQVLATKYFNWYKIFFNALYYELCVTTYTIELSALDLLQ